MGWGGQSHAPAASTLGKDPVPIVQGAGWAPGLVWKGETSRPHRDSIPDRLARSQSLYRLSYPLHIYIYIYILIGMCKRRVTTSPPTPRLATHIPVPNPFSFPFRLKILSTLGLPRPQLVVQKLSFSSGYFLNRLFVSFPIHYSPTSLSLLKQIIFIAHAMVTWFPSHQMARIQPKKEKKIKDRNKKKRGFSYLFRKERNM